MRAKGTVGIYRKRIQVKVKDPKDLVQRGYDPPDDLGELPAGGLMAEMKGKLVAVAGEVAGIEDLAGKGRKLTLKTTEGPVTVVLWSSVTKKLGFELKAGIKLRIKGMVDDYKGALQVVPKWPKHVTAEE